VEIDVCRMSGCEENKEVVKKKTIPDQTESKHGALEKARLTATERKLRKHK